MQCNVGCCSTLTLLPTGAAPPRSTIFCTALSNFFLFLVGLKCPLASTNYMFLGKFLYKTNDAHKQINKDSVL